MEKNKNAIVVTNPMIAANRSAEVTLSKFLKVMISVHPALSVVGGNVSLTEDLHGIKVYSYKIRRANSKIKRAMDIMLLQLKMAVCILQKAQKNQAVYFWIADKMIIPYLAAKVKKSEINYFIYGNVGKEGKITNFTNLSAKLIRYMAKHADSVCVESPSVVNEWSDLKYKRVKTIHLYSDIIGMNPIKDRTQTLGMVCRLTSGKHVLECIEAMSKVHLNYPDWKLEIIGSGKQEAECRESIKCLCAESYITLLGWVGHDEIVNKTRNWRFLLFPTDTEGMPNGLIEMMGRGIPALASPVGGISDIIKEGNGFILKSTTSDEISTSIINMINMPQTEYEHIATNAFNIIEKEFSLKGAKEKALKDFEV